MHPAVQAKLPSGLHLLSMQCYCLLVRKTRHIAAGTGVWQHKVAHPGDQLQRRMAQDTASKSGSKHVNGTFHLSTQVERISKVTKLFLLNNSSEGKFIMLTVG